MSGKQNCKIKQLLCSNSPIKQILGTILDRRLNLVVFSFWGMMLTFALVLGVLHLVLLKSEKWCVCYCLLRTIKSPWYWMALLTLFVVLVFLVGFTLMRVYNLQKKEKYITRCYLAMLGSIGMWVIGFLILFDINKDSRYYLVIGLVGTLLMLVFQEKIRGAATYLHLRVHGLLNIDDWIKIPKYEIDGEVKRVTLTSVTVLNWDTTTSTIPISALSSDHFMNLQNMMKGKTYGRRMMMKFTLDTSWFHPITTQEIESVKEHDGIKYMPEEEMRDSKGNFRVNAHLFRLYLYHWLMEHGHVSQQPRLIVRWEEPKEGGMPLEIYAFIIDSGLAQYEWQRSQIVEHVIESMGWFGLRLYQSPSAYDVSNSNIFMAKEPATYGKENV